MNKPFTNDQERSATGIVLPNHRAVQDVLQLANRIIADGGLTAEEARDFVEWVDEHPEIAIVPPVPILARRLRRFLSDGVLDDREQAEVLKALRQLVGQEEGPPGPH